MTRDQILTQLWAVRAIVDALAAGLQSEPTPDGGCEHPESLRQDASTMGGPRKFYCKACKQIVEDV